MSRHHLYAAVFLFAQLGCLPAQAEDEQAVKVNGIRSPELKPYRFMLAGLDAFDEHRAMAPKAHALRFKLRPKDGVAAGAMEEVSLRIAGNDSSVNLPLSADGTFILPRLPDMDEDADLVVNQKKGLYRWRADIHSDGVPSDMRRLGDLRLECEVVVAVGKKGLAFWQRALITTFLLTDQWCGSKRMPWNTDGARPLKSATLVSGERRLALELRYKGRSYVSMIGDKSFPDDALIEFEYADEAAKEPAKEPAEAGAAAP
jgi:hypothetical protein